MLKGRYGNTSGRPYISGHLTIPALGIDGYISFLIDTGSDCTVLMPADAAALGLDYRSLTVTDDSIGFGGISRDYLVPAIVIFAEPGKTAHAWQITLRVGAPKAEHAKTPSIVGRDIINDWCITFDPTSDRLDIEIISSHAQHDLRSK